MISFLIPCYNYDAFPLVEELYYQCTKEPIEFEILVLDDASPINENTHSNEKINKLSNCFYSRNENNLGRSKNRNTLVSKAKHKWVLFLDCDTFPKSKMFIHDYLATINNSSEAVYGGICYSEEKPKQEEMLRWIYGNAREAITVTKRNEKPYSTTLISNFLIKKEIVLSVSFDNEITKYGYEDLVLIQDLKDKNIVITHIDNPVYHLNLDTTTIFLEKTHQSIENLKMLYDEKRILPNQTSLLRLYVLLYKLRLRNFIVVVFSIFKKSILKNLYSSNPSLRVFLFYKLGYFCKLNDK